MADCPVPPAFVTHDSKSRAHRAHGVCCAQVHHLSVCLGGHTIVADIDLHVHCGEMLTIVGPNGAGKTTLLRALVGEIPYRGTFQFEAVHDGARATRPRIGYVPQQIALDKTAPVTVLDLFCAALSAWPVCVARRRDVRAQAAAALTLVDAQPLLAMPLGALSGGQLQRVLLALALAPLPDIVLLDEPLAALDQAGTRAFYRTVSHLREQFDLSVIMVSHNLAAAAAVSDRFVCLQQRIICAGAPHMVLADPAARAVLGLPRREDGA
jgi:zinc transport system ATP-binding protein